MHDRMQDRRALGTAAALTAGFFACEVAGGLLTNSLALLSDAAHMFTDLASLALAFFALWIAARAPTGSKTFGYARAEILAALVNGVLLCVSVLWIAREAYERLNDPAPVHGGAMTAIAAVGLGVNVFCAWILTPREGSSLNLRAAFFHVLADLLGSLGALGAGLVILATGWYGVDPLAAFAIAALVLVSAWRLLREALDVLMEAVPEHIDLNRLRQDLESVPGTDHVHDLHVWTLTTGHYALSAHAVIDGTIDGERILEDMQRLLAAQFQIDHVTIQLERARPCEPESVHA